MASFANIIKNKEKEHAYIDGANAYQKGEKLSDNPYFPTSHEGKEWIDGWTDAEYLYCI